ncbi:MAG: ABC transporter ATP-binding protein [Pseudomonadota bacterium]|nr:ABC transporter ATP-binding protein [Pseudomonadota bacterium]
MAKSAINVERVWKEYAVGTTHPRHGTFYDLLGHAMKAPLRLLSRAEREESAATRFQALRDVSFEVQPGEVMGVVGRNGAGKSTLLKVLSRITAPSRGRVTMRGRVASLLEVGTGFHPELSGRENIYLNATILGMGKREITRKFDPIVEFSGIERFLDTPVKRYSSGMYVRLAFAVAAHVEADILLIDEVLAVGDADFQKRCLGMMGEVAREGRTVLFVSHNLTALRNLCTEGLLLNAGSVESFGAIGDVLQRYALGASGEGTSVADFADRMDGEIASLQRVSVGLAESETGASISIATAVSIKVRFSVHKPDSEIGVFVSCLDESQNMVFSTGSFFERALSGVKLAAGRHEFSCEIPGNLLNAGDYTLDVSLIRDRSEVFLSEPAVVAFHIHEVGSLVEGWNWPIRGVIRPNLRWSARIVNDSAVEVREAGSDRS